MNKHEFDGPVTQAPTTGAAMPSSGISEREEYADAINRMRSFFAIEVSKFILPDIDRLTHEIRPEGAEGMRGCTVPLVLMLFAVVDYFGFLMREDKDANKRETKKNFHFFLVKSKYFSPVMTEDQCAMVLRLFRHGLMHQFFPKACGIAKVQGSLPLIFEAQGMPILNADVFSDGVARALVQIRSDVLAEMDKNLVLRMKRRLDSLTQDDYQERDELWP